MKLNVFRTTMKDGNFTKEKKYYPNLSTKEIDLLYETNINRLLKGTGLDIKNYVVLSQKSKELKSRTVTETTKKVKEQILVLKGTTPDVAVLVETTDDPVIVASANNICAIVLGTIENLNNNILHEMIETLIKETDAAPFEMTFYITGCPYQKNYQLDSIEKLTDQYIWKDTYIKKRKKYYLDIRYAIYNQLLYEIVDPHYIYFDSKDTTENKNYYSNLADRPGVNLTCVVYTNEEDV